MTERKLRLDATRIFRAALKAADPVEAVLRHLSVEGDVLAVGGGAGPLTRVEPPGSTSAAPRSWRRYNLRAFRRIYVLGAGKASAAMAQAVERVLGRRITGGLVNVKDGHLAKLRRVQLNECSHPVPDERGVDGARRISAIAAAAGAEDLILCVLSGGGSALLPMPVAGVTLEEKQAVTKLLLASGATIHEINAVRKHISGIKGGQLASLAWPATTLSLLLSDVIGDDLDVIGSGPTAPDSSTFASAKGILDKYGIFGKAPQAVRQRLEAGVLGEVPETPKPGGRELSRTQNVIIGSNRLAVDAAAAEARELGYRTLVLSTFVEGETRDVAKVHTAIAKEVLASGRPVKAPACIISGGETTVTLRGEGLGGRNQEFALAAALELPGRSVVVLSGGTDGTDGPTDAAGALASGTTLGRATKLGLDAKDFLARNDSYHFFDALGDLLKTGPTNTNVMDVRLMLIG